jgi:hypothetical protein
MSEIFLSEKTGLIKASLSDCVITENIAESYAPGYSREKAAQFRRGKHGPGRSICAE